MIPRHTNPSVLLNSTAIVSRAALHDSDDDDEPAQADPQHAQLLARLENILKRSIEDVLPPTPQPDGHDDSDKSRKKKRRKLEREQGQEEAVEGQVEEEAVAAVRTFTPTSWDVFTFINALSISFSSSFRKYPTEGHSTCAQGQAQDSASLSSLLQVAPS